MNKFALLLVFLSSLAPAKITLPHLFSDHMVLQQNSTVRIWGTADPHEPVALTTGWDKKTYTTKGDSYAKWSLEIKTPSYGGPYTLTLKGYNTIEINDVMIGEVWIGSGQSNMEMTPAWGIENGLDEIAQAHAPHIRFFKLEKSTAPFPQISAQSAWQSVTPEVMKNNSALGYFFSQRLSKELQGVPVGFIVSAWGGSPAEVWIPEEEFSENKLAQSELEKLETSDAWPSKAGAAYNAMVHPLLPYGFHGVLWYQGESNTGSQSYANTLETLIRSWRKQAGREFPFYVVQIAPYNYGAQYDGGARIRDAQRRILSVAHTGMVVTSDLSTTDDIHPKQKKQLGERMADLVLSKRFARLDLVAEGPLLKEAVVRGRKMVLSFHNSQGMYVKGGTRSPLFELAGEDGVFHPAQGVVRNGTIEVYSNAVKIPQRVRYAWKNTDQADVFNSAGIPMSTFTTEY